LSKAPEDITAGEVIRVLEGPIILVDVEEENDAARRKLWKRVRDAIAEVLDSTTLSDLIQESSDKDETDGYMFYI